MSNSDDETDSLNLVLSKLPTYESNREESDETVWYNLRYHRDIGAVDHVGKLIEFGKLADCSHEDLKPLADDDYTHYGIFRMKEDRSTTTLIQDADGGIYKVFSFSRSNVEVSYSVDISVLDN